MSLTVTFGRDWTLFSCEYVLCFICYYSRLKRIRRVPLSSLRRLRRRKRVDLEERPRRRFVHPFIVTWWFWTIILIWGTLLIELDGSKNWFNESEIYSLFLYYNTRTLFWYIFLYFLQKWSKGKVRDKLNNQVLFDKPTYEKLLKEVPQYKLITPSIVSERLKIRGSLARRALIELQQKGLIKQVVQHHAQLIYTRTTKGDDPAV